MTDVKTAPPVKLSAPHGELTKVLKLMEFGVETNSQNRALRGVLLESVEDGVRLKATDLETVISALIRADVSGNSGRSLLNHKELTKVLAAAAAGETAAAAARIPVTIEGDVLMTPDLAAPVEAYPVENYPHLRAAAPYVATVDGPELFRQAARVIPAAGTDDTLPGLMGVQMAVEGGRLHLAATDRYRLPVAELETQDVAEDIRPVSASALFPAKTLRKFMQMLRGYKGQVVIGMADYVTLTVGGVEISGRPFESSFPKYRSLFPKAYHAGVQVDREAMTRATKKAGAVLAAKGKRNSPCTLTYGPTGITVAPALDPDERDKVRGMHAPGVQAYGSLESLRMDQMGFNPSFLLDALGAFTEECITIHIQQTEENRRAKPILITEGPEAMNEDYRHLLMPIDLR